MTEGIQLNNWPDLNDRRYNNEFAQIRERAQVWAILPGALKHMTTFVFHCGGHFRSVGFKNLFEPALGATTATIQAGRGGAQSKTGNVGVMRIRGPILAEGFDGFFFSIPGLDQYSAELNRMASAGDIDSILLDINSPGGEVTGVSEFAANVRQVAKQKPVTVFTSGMMASAAYWIGAQGTTVLASESALTGSIGVITHHIDESKHLENEGVDVEVLSAGKNKAGGYNRLGPLTEEDRTEIQGHLDHYYGMFTRDVAKGRGVKQSEVKNGFGEGSVVTAKQALSEGMIDGIATFEQAVKTAATLDSPAASARAEVDRRKRLVAYLDKSGGLS